MLSPLTRINGQMTGKLAPPGFFQLCLPTDAALTQREFDISPLQATLAQLFTNSCRAIAGSGSVGDETSR